MCPTILIPSSTSRPPTPIPLGCPRAPALSALLHALVIYFTYGNIRVSVLFSHIVTPRLLPHSPKVCSLHLCLFFYPEYRVVVVTVFLNSIYMH